MENQLSKGNNLSQLSRKMLSVIILSAVSLSVNAFQCSIYEGGTSEIPSFKTEIAELKNMEKRGRHVKILVPKQGPVQEFDLTKFVKNGGTNADIKQKLALVEGGTVVYIDLYLIEKRYEIRLGSLTTNLAQVIKPTVYANFDYNLQHNEVYDLQSRIAVFCN